jgi:hypothetical protein
VSGTVSSTLLPDSASSYTFSMMLGTTIRRKKLRAF